MPLDSANFLRNVHIKHSWLFLTLAPCASAMRVRATALPSLLDITSPLLMMCTAFPKSSGRPSLAACSLARAAASVKGVCNTRYMDSRSPFLGKLDIWTCRQARLALTPFQVKGGQCAQHMQSCDLSLTGLTTMQSYCTGTPFFRRGGSMGMDLIPRHVRLDCTNDKLSKDAHKQITCLSLKAAFIKPFPCGC